MYQRQAVEFLRRRYAAAILCNDPETAGRLRARLDGIMNHAPRAGWPSEAQPQAQAAPAADRDAPPRQAEMPAAARSTDRPAPRLRLVTPVTGLLEWPSDGRRER